MNNETMSARNMGSIVVAIVMCSAILSGASIAGQDAWLAGICAIGFSVPLMLVYMRICKLYPQMSLYQIIDTVFGNVLGRVVNVCLTFYAICVGAFVVHYFVDFTRTIAFQDTPPIPLMLLLFAVSLYIAKSGFFTMGRWAMLCMIAVVLNLVGTVLLAIPVMKVENLFPILTNSPATILEDALTCFSVSFGEIIIVLITFPSVRKGEKLSKVFLGGFALGGLMLLSVLNRNLMILGDELISVSKYPSYMGARLLQFGDVFERIESLVSLNLILLGVIKASLSLSAAAMGMENIMRDKNYKDWLLPMMLVGLAICSVVFNGVFDMLGFISTYRIVALPFQVFLPILVWIFAEIKSKRQKAVAAS